MASFFPKLEVFKITLKPYKNKGETFSDFFKLIINADTLNNLQNDKLFIEFFKYFIKEIDKESFYLKDKKGFTAYNTNIDKNPSIRFNSKEFYFNGFVEGGVYGIKRSSSNIANKNLKNDIPEDNIVSNRFYFLLHLPPESQYGILMILSYSVSTITSLFINFIEDTFKKEKYYYKPDISRYIPESFKETFKQESILKRIRFETVAPSKQLDNASYQIEDEELIIKVEVASHKNISSSNASKFYNAIKDIKIGSIKLQDFIRRKVDVNDHRGQTSSFEVDREFDPSPKIYLEGKVELNIDGTPNDQSLINYSLSLLKEVKQKIYPVNNVTEH